MAAGREQFGAKLMLLRAGKFAEQSSPPCLCYQRFLMRETNLFLLSTSILTSFGAYTYEPLTLEQARALLREIWQEGKTIQSAIGHQSTAELLTTLLEFPVAANRIEFKQAVDDLALI